MSPKAHQNHSIDILFPVVLLFIFAISALSVILLASNVYQSTTENSSLNYTARTSLAYITEKIHQNDTEGMVSLGTYDGCEALIMEQLVEGEIYKTYIYLYENQLKELYVKDGVQIPAQNGQTILSVNSFSMSIVGNGIFRFTCTDANGQTASTMVAIHSWSTQDGNDRWYSDLSSSAQDRTDHRAMYKGVHL